MTQKHSHVWDKIAKHEGGREAHECICCGKVRCRGGGEYQEVYDDRHDARELRHMNLVGDAAQFAAGLWLAG